jgi:alpha-amylase
MGVALIAWGRFVKRGEKVTVPAPNTEPGAPWLWDFLASAAADLRRSGFTALQLPPASKAQGGEGAGCDGYGVFDPRDLGVKPQQGSIPTRYGDADALRRMIACCHAVGLDVYFDIVLHQLMGENGGPGTFRYLGADGHTLNGRGPMEPGSFRGGTGNHDPIPPFRPEDAVPAPKDDFPFGREKVYQNCEPPGYTINDALDFGDWLFRTTDADGMRFDDVKGTWAPFVSQFMRAGAMASKFAYAEYFDGNPALLDAWVTQPPMQSRSLVADFPLHWALQAACDGANVAALDGAGYASRNPFLACTFVDNPDTDTSPGEQIISSKMLAYAFLLTTEGYPFVYGKDYFGNDVWPGAYGLKPWIDNLIWIHEKLAFGNTITRYLDDHVIVLERTGHPGLLTALNFDPTSGHTINCETAFGAKESLHEYTGKHPDIKTDAQGRASFTIPSNAHLSGQSYLVFSRLGFDAGFQFQPRATSQTFFGAEDLDIPALRNGAVNASRVYAGLRSSIHAVLEPNGAAWVHGASVALEIAAPDGGVIASKTIHHGDPAAALVALTRQQGWHTLSAHASGLAGMAPYELNVTYQGAQQMEESRP